MTTANTGGESLPGNKSLSDILTPGVISVSPRAPLSEALERMSRERISSLVCLHRGRPSGILTERGLLRALAGLQGDGLARPVKEVMSSPVLCAPAETPVHVAFGLLQQKGLRHLVVVDDKGKALGMITQTNMVQNLGVEYFVDVKRVGQIMSRRVANMAPDRPLADALRLMVEGPYSCVVCGQEGTPEGILSERDMVRLLALRADLSAHKLRDVMSRPVVTVAESTPVHQAAELMGRQAVRRLVVLGGDGRVNGLLTQSDIVKGMEARYLDALRQVIREKDDLLRSAVDEVARKTLYLDSILNSSMDTGIVATDGTRVVFMNQTARKMLGVVSSAPIGADLLDLHKAFGVPAKKLQKVFTSVKRGADRHFHAEVRAEDGRPRFLEGRVSSICGDMACLDGLLLTLRDVTDKRAAEQTIRHMAYHDALTGLPNRFLVTDRLELGLAQARRRGCLLAVMLLDLDGFKRVNDTLGHNVGDQLLQAVAERLGGLLRKSDTVGRMGGDEFLVVLPEVKTPEGAAAVAAKMLRAVYEKRTIAGHSLKISTSIGLAFYPWDGNDAQTLIQKADTAMYAAKDAGRNGYRFACDRLNDQQGFGPKAV